MGSNRPVSQPSCLGSSHHGGNKVRVESGVTAVLRKTYYREQPKRTGKCVSEMPVPIRGRRGSIGDDRNPIRLRWTVQLDLASDLQHRTGFRLISWVGFDLPTLGRTR